MADNKEKKDKKVKRPTALKRDDQSEKRCARNRAFKSAVRKKVRSLKDSIEEKVEKALLTTDLNSAYSLLDKGVKKGIYKKNAASRTKARLAAQVSKAV